MAEEIKILCVDDEPSVLNALRRLFLDEEYTIITATSAQDGLKLLESEHAQVVLSDYRMPTMNGVEFLKEVCSLWPNTVRIVLSGYADTAAVVAAVNEGEIFKFIPKPWNNDELKLAVAKAIKRYYLSNKNNDLAAELLKVNEDLKNLLDENSKVLEFRREMLEMNQEILFSLPIAVLGISDNVVVQCNEAWAKEAGDQWGALGESIEEVLSPEIVEFVRDVQAGEGKKRRLMLNGVPGTFLGSSLRGRNNKVKGVILVFIREASV
ncbi:MAG: response regulator [Dissulfurispiraceae bacterium]